MKLITRLIPEFYFIFLLSSFFFMNPAGAQSLKENPALDEKVRKFLSEHSRQWQDMNVPSIDGQLLYDIIIKNNYKSALEIGTSTGHSGIWIAWALSKTGGKLITIDIDEGRYKTALENFRQAGLSEYIDARLADAHQLGKRTERYLLILSSAMPTRNGIKTISLMLIQSSKQEDALLHITFTTVDAVMEVTEDRVLFSIM